MRTNFALAFLTSTIVLAAANSSRGDNWPRWRGPTNDGVAPAGDYPLEWSSSPEDVAWNYPLGERSGSTPVVWDGSIFVASTSGGSNTLICLDQDRKERWKQTIGESRDPKHPKYGSGTHPSPVTDGQHVYTYYKSGDLACLDFDGNIVWEKNLQEEYGEDTLWWDLGTSPVLTDKAVVIAVLHSGPSYIVALDKESGSELWKQDRTFQVAEENDHSYTTPIVATRDGREILLVVGADHVTAHDADSGKEIWRAGGLAPRGRGNLRSIASPVLADDILVVPYVRGETITAFRIDGSGDVTESHQLWSIHTPGRPGAVDVPTPAVEGNRVYFVGDQGLAYALDARSGEILWSKELPRTRQVFRSSPIVAGDRIYYTREDGITFVLSKPAEGEEPELLATNELGEFTIATPVLVDGRIFIRTTENLYCIE